MFRPSSPSVLIERWSAYQSKYHQNKKVLVDSFKSGPCKRCGGFFPPACMDFHHRDPSQKAFSIGRKMDSVSRARILLEIQKCDLLCANCHRLVDHEELKNGTQP